MVPAALDLSYEQRHPIRWLLGFLRPYLAVFFSALVALALAAGALLSLPVAIRFVIDNGLAAGGEKIDHYFLFLLLLALLYGVFTGLRVYLLNWLGERVCVDLRNQVYQHVLRFDIGYFEEVSTGAVLSRVLVDTTVIRRVAGSGLTVVLRSSVIFVSALTMLMLTSIKLSLAVVLLIGPMLVPVLLLGKRVRRLAREAQDEMARTGGIATETLHGIKTVQSYTLEALQSRRFAQAVWSTFVASKRRAGTRAVLMATSITTLFSTITFVLWLGVQAVLGGSLSSGQLGQFLLYALLVAHSVVALTEAWSEVQAVAGASERLTEIMATQPSIRSPEDPVPLPSSTAASVRFDHVDFSYPSRPDELALDDFDLDIRAGETIGLVGHSGAGKSTVMNLLQRFSDPTAGRILVNGVDIRSADLGDLRGAIGIVPQEPLIFAANALENMRYGRPDASDEEVYAAARAARADEFLAGLPDGYDTFLGQHGSRLSGGQRQRIAIARAILKNPPILLLDEATNMLDSHNEDLVQQALDELMRDRTTLVIAHRLATLCSADRIVVLDEGRIINIGRHRELLEQDDLYARLAELQLAV